MYVTCGASCTKITSDQVVDVVDLRTSHEEADGRLLLHANHASVDVKSVIIIGNDTDIMILCLAFHDSIDCDLFIRCKSKTRTWFFDVSKTAAALGKEVCQALPGMHAYTGCDSVSSFGGRGKISALNILKKSQQFQETFKKLGKSWSVPPDVSRSLEEFTCRLYATQSDITDVNELRFQLFRLKKGNIDSGQLPPCKDTLQLHIVRSNYQTAIWRRSLENHPAIPSPLDCSGWVLDEESRLQINWMTGSPAPDIVLEFLTCKCSRYCRLPYCECMANGLQCTSACKLQSCDNMKDYEEDELQTDEEIDDEDMSSDNE